MLLPYLLALFSYLIIVFFYIQNGQDDYIISRCYIPGNRYIIVVEILSDWSKRTANMS